MKLYSLYFSRKKKGKQTLLMTDSLVKCENYRKAREATKNSKAGNGFYEIREAEKDQETYKVKGANREKGWIGKHGWSDHT